MLPDSTTAALVSRRVPIATRCRRHDGDGSWVSVNLSDSGAFLRGEPLLLPDTEFLLGVALPNTGVEIIGDARVVWTNDPNVPGTDPRLPVGMGVTFTRLDRDSRRRLCTGIYGRDTSGDEMAPPRPWADDEEDVLEPGTLIGSYRIDSLLGSGGMSHVYRAEHLGLGRMVALKSLRSRYSGDRDAIRRFFEEGRLVNRVSHPHIVEVTDFIAAGPDKYYVMELLEGRSLGEEIHRNGAMAVERVLNIAVQLFETLAVVHAADIVHRDLKPDNIYLVERLDHPDFVKLLDFGIAKMTLPDGGLLETVPGFIVGTPTYMAPEYGLGEPSDIRSDIYSAGHVLYEMVTGQATFAGGSWAEALIANQRERPTAPSTRAPTRLPRALNRLILRCLEKAPEARPQSAKEVADELHRIRFDFGGEPVRDAMLLPLDALRYHPSLRRLAAALRKHRRTTLLLTLATILTTALGIGLLHFRNQQPSPSPRDASPPPVTAASRAKPAAEAVKSKPKPKRRRGRKARSKKFRRTHRRGTINPFEN